MLISSTFESGSLLAQSEERGANKHGPVFETLAELDLTFYLDYFLFLNCLRTLVALKMLL